MLRVICIFIILICTYSCKKQNEIVYEPNKQIDAFKIYKEGLEAFDKNDFFDPVHTAPQGSKKIAEIIFPPLYNYLQNLNEIN